MRLLFLIALFVGCAEPEQPSADFDGDGAIGVNDCDESDPAINAWATEICNGLDDDCDEAIDEGLANEFWRDLDGDGFGDPFKRELRCEASEGLVPNDADCDDADALVNPSAEEIPNNGVDDDCKDGDLVT